MFSSYGVEPGDRSGLIAAMPEAHKAFLRDLARAPRRPTPTPCAHTYAIAVASAISHWRCRSRMSPRPLVHAALLQSRPSFAHRLLLLMPRCACITQAWMRSFPFLDESTGEPCDLLAVHAGLDASERLSSQVDLALTKAAERHWLEIFQGRSNVAGRHPEVPETTVVASGHHGGSLVLEPGRVILDTMGGYAERPFTGLVVRGRDPGGWQTVRDEDETSPSAPGGGGEQTAK